MTSVAINDDVCRRCGSNRDWEDCWQCGGEGEIDRYDEDPLWYFGKWRYQKCDNCEGEGGYYVCWSCEAGPERVSQ